MDRPSRTSEAWQLLLELLTAAAGRRPAIAADLHLSEPQCRVLELLAPEAPLPMCRVAEALDCDPSNVTGIIDRLEARGLVERRTDPRDRRVKKLALTARGAEQRVRLLERLSEPPAAVHALSAADQTRLCGILRRAIAAESCREEGEAEAGRPGPSPPSGRRRAPR